MRLFELLLSFLLVITPSSEFLCDDNALKATIRNNLNGDYEIINDLENIDFGAFVNLEWKEISLMLPISFKAGEISFTDNKWLWSYKDKNSGLHINTPKFSQRLPNGIIVEHECELSENTINQT